MNNAKLELLQSAYNYCNEHDKSTEYMIEFMKNFANASHDEVIKFLETNFNQNKNK